MPPGAAPVPDFADSPRRLGISATDSQSNRELFRPFTGAPHAPRIVAHGNRYCHPHSRAAAGYRCAMAEGRYTSPKPLTRSCSCKALTRWSCSRAVMQIAHPLPHLLQNLPGLQRRKQVARLLFVNDIRSNYRTYAVDGKRDYVMAVHLYSIWAETVDCKKVFRISFGMLGRSAECYADAVRPK